MSHDLQLIRHYAESAGWPEEAADFARRAASYFSDLEDNRDEWPDWSASEILEWILHDLAQALERSADPGSGGSAQR